MYLADSFIKASSSSMSTTVIKDSKVSSVVCRGLFLHRSSVDPSVVMRACEGCRRRKIKCDGATTNVWPCSSCGRLKLQCVPPAIDGETGEDEGKSLEPEAEPPAYNSHNDIYSNDVIRPISSHESSNLDSTPQQPEARESYAEDKPFPQVALFNDQTHSQMHHGMLAYSNPSLPYLNHESFPTPPTRAVSDTAESWHSDHSGPDFTEAMGQLKIDDAGLGMSSIYCSVYLRLMVFLKHLIFDSKGSQT